jgi:hypothetical protein
VRWIVALLYSCDVRSFFSELRVTELRNAGREQDS